MKYAATVEFRKQIKLLYQQGGRNKDAVDEYHKVCGKWMNDPKKDPIGKLLQRTKTKEKRINDRVLHLGIFLDKMLSYRMKLWLNHLL